MVLLMKSLSPTQMDGCCASAWLTQTTLRRQGRLREDKPVRTHSLLHLPSGADPLSQSHALHDRIGERLPLTARSSPA